MVVRNPSLKMKDVIERAVAMGVTVTVNYNVGMNGLDKRVPVSVTLYGHGHKLTEIPAQGFIDREDRWPDYVFSDSEYIPRFIWGMLDAFEMSLRAKKVEKVSDDISL